MESIPDLVLGVDVGGTNTDAVILEETKCIHFAKSFTTEDVTTGVKNAVSMVLRELNEDQRERISRVNIGTTHFVNAVVQRREVCSVAVIRLCGDSCTCLPPFVDFPEDLKKSIGGNFYMVSGGLEFNGDEISSPDESELKNTVEDIKNKKIRNLVISGVFSPLNSGQEEWAAKIVKEVYPEASITQSHKVGLLSLLERENASILNESLKPLCLQTISGLRVALDELGLQTSQLFLTQNDGTIISADHCLNYPVHTFSSGPTNSMRGAAQLSKIDNAIVIDIGGTTSDVGVLQKGFPREASSHVKVGGVNTNFQMPDVLSIGLGGGSLVRPKWNQMGKIESVRVGPDSTGFNLEKESLVFGGKTLTTTDIAVAAGMADIGDKSKVADLSPELVQKALEKIHSMLETAIDQVKLVGEEMPVILVGGGSILIDSNKALKGASQVLKPERFEVANAVGAALGQVSGRCEKIFDLSNCSREEALKLTKNEACQNAVKNGAKESTIKITELRDISLKYLPGSALKVSVRVVGDIEPGQTQVQVVQPDEPMLTETTPSTTLDNIPSMERKEVPASSEAELSMLRETPPTLDPQTGEWLLSEWDVECISVGAGILGCGGGGNPYVGRLIVLNHLKAGKQIRVVTPEKLPSGGLVANVAFMGAPAVMIEKLPAGTETKLAFQCTNNLMNMDLDQLQNLGEAHIKKSEVVTFIDDFRKVEGLLGANKVKEEKTIVGIMPLEIGGLNSMEPLAAGALLDLPVVDADGMGRAFPELQMVAPYIYGVPSCPSTLADNKGRLSVTLHADTTKDLENHFRSVVIGMGCMGGLSMRPLEKSEVLGTCILHSLSRAWSLGREILCARIAKTSPTQALIDHQNGKLLIFGKVADVTKNIEGGFNKGRVKMEGTGTYSNQTLWIDLQNEYLLATLETGDGPPQILASTPDLITLVDTETGQPIPTDELRYGLRLTAVCLPSPPTLRTEQAIKVVGPQAFGYHNVTFKPVGDYLTFDPVPRKD